MTVVGFDITSFEYLLYFKVMPPVGMLVILVLYVP